MIKRLAVSVLLIALMLTCCFASEGKDEEIIENKYKIINQNGIPLSTDPKTSFVVTLIAFIVTTVMSYYMYWARAYISGSLFAFCAVFCLVFTFLNVKSRLSTNDVI